MALMSSPFAGTRTAWRLLLFSYLLAISHNLVQAVAIGPQLETGSVQKFDLVVYGCTSAGVVAAIQTARMNRTVGLVCPETHLGGLTSSGLGWTDSKDGVAIGGIAREFYAKIYDHYSAASAWKAESRADYLSKKIMAQPGPAIDEHNRVQWTFEPSVAEHIFDDWIHDYNISLFKNQRIIRSPDGVVIQNKRIVSMKTKANNVFAGRMFIDAGYEGDLMDTAGIPSSIGRESIADYNESLAGIRVDHDPNVYSKVDPYIEPGNRASGVLPGIQRIIASGQENNGKSDPLRLQSYNFRLSLTKSSSANFVPFSKPAGYNVDDFELLLRYAEQNRSDATYLANKPMPNLKTDTNAAGAVSTDLLGGNYDVDAHISYANASYTQRDAMIAKHKAYTTGFLYTMSANPRVPLAVRKYFGDLGWAKDEFASNDFIPYGIYIREARRMIGKYVMTQLDVQQQRKLPASDSVIGLGSYTLDVHYCERVVENGSIYNEGLVHQAVAKPFPIPLNSILPADDSITNFANPVTMSSTHIALASIRMEPTYMILGQSAATALVVAIEQDVDVQMVDRNQLTDRLAADGQVLSV